MTRRILQRAALAAVLGLAAAARAGPPNIVFLITDDQGYGDLSCHGNPDLATPNLDRLHAESVRFTRFQASPTCAPTRSAIMSGRHPFRNGVTHTILERERMALDTVTLPEILRAAGYATGIFGKWHLGDQPPYQPGRRGFDEVFIHGAGGIGQSYDGSCGDAPGNGYVDPWILHNGVFEKTNGFCTDVFFRQALAWMGGQLGRGPFFAYISTNAPHSPFHAPEAYRQRFLDAGWNEAQAGFYGMIANIDDNVGRLLDRLSAWGIASETLVVFMTDNGQTGSPNRNGPRRMYNAGMKGNKGSVDEGGTRVPCFFRWPGTLPAGVDVDRVAAHLDLLPTLAELAGAAVPARVREGQLEGRSLVPLLRDRDAPWADRYLFSHVGRWPRGADPRAHRDDRFSVRSQRYRLVGREALFDLVEDPGQSTNVAAAHPEVVAGMLAAYDAWWEASLPRFVNEDAALEGPNTFRELFERQVGPAPP